MAAPDRLPILGTGNFQFMTAFQNFMAAGTKQAINAFSAQVVTWRGHTLRCDLGEEMTDLALAEAGIKNAITRTMVVLKSIMPSGTAFKPGDIVTIDGSRREVDTLDQDEITYTLRLVYPRQK